MRNPKWHRDEIILALDLFFSKDRGTIDKKNPKIIELSKMLNDLPLFTDRPDRAKFRNPNGVALKLSNFLPFDDNYKGTGMRKGSKQDKEIFFEFYRSKQRLRAIAYRIKHVVDNSKISEQIAEIEDDEQTFDDSVIEGQILYKLHKVRERNSLIVKEKKIEALNQFGKISCEACVFNFEDYYGDIGKGYIECHHRTPLASIQLTSETKLHDLALVCSNCHRMLHRKISTITVEDLRMIIKYDRIRC
jgi:5-methylcytosine-specific restriction enzyme A